MPKTKLDTTLQLRRVAALPYNPYFEQRIIGIRKKYGISETARSYHFIDPSLEKYIGGDHVNVEESTLIGEDITITLPSKSSGIKGQLPSDINQLLADFGLPAAIFDSIFYYVFTNHKSSISDWVAHDVGASITFGEDVHFGEEESDGETNESEELTVEIKLSRWSTKKTWNRLWDNHIKAEISKLQGTQGQLAKKANLSSTTRKQIERWAEWYQLSEVQGLGPVRALGKWEEDHLGQEGKFDLSTITHAIQEFKGIITPTPIED